MYNKLFTKILDSSIWLEKNTTRIVWLTLIAAMDEDGFCQFASSANLAHRAIVDPKECDEAIKCLESEDPNSSDKEHDGKRIERVPGGWMVLNSEKYKDLVTREISKERTRERVRRHREKHKVVTKCNGEVRNCNDSVTQSDTDTKTNKESKEDTNYPFKVFNELWCKEFKEFFGSPYKFQGVKDATCSQSLVKLLSPLELVEIAKRAWALRDKFNCKMSVSISGFSARFNEIRSEIGELKQQEGKKIWVS